MVVVPRRLTGSRVVLESESGVLVFGFGFELEDGTGQGCQTMPVTRTRWWLKLLSLSRLADYLGTFPKRHSPHGFAAALGWSWGNGAVSLSFVGVNPHAAGMPAEPREHPGSPTPRRSDIIVFLCLSL